MLWLVQEVAAQGPAGMLPAGFVPLCGRRQKLTGGSAQALLPDGWPRQNACGRWPLEWYVEQHCMQYSVGCSAALWIGGFWRH